MEKELDQQLDEMITAATESPGNDDDIKAPVKDPEITTGSEAELAAKVSAETPKDGADDNGKNGDGESPDNKSPDADADKQADADPNNTDSEADDPAPRGFSAEFRDGTWKKLDAETKSEITRVYNNQDEYISRLQGEKNAREESIKPFRGYIQEVAGKAKIDNNEVIRNCVAWISHLEIAPEKTILDGLSAGAVKFKNPEAVIRGIANLCGLNLNNIVSADPKLGLAEDRAFISQQGLDSRRISEEHDRLNETIEADRQVAEVLSEFKQTHPDVDYKNPRFEAEIKIAAAENPQATMQDLLEVAYHATHSVPAPLPPQKKTDISAKMAKVSVKGTTPTDVPKTAKKVKFSSNKDEDEFLNNSIGDAIR